MKLFLCFIPLIFLIGCAASPTIQVTDAIVKQGGNLDLHLKIEKGNAQIPGLMIPIKIEGLELDLRIFLGQQSQSIPPHDGT